MGVYARRPKILGSKNQSILVKVNRELFSAARMGLAIGIPVLIGVPLVASLEDFSIHCPCALFHLRPHTGTEDDYLFELRLPEGSPIQQLDQRLAGPLDHTDVVQLLLSQGRQMSWEIAVEKMREMRSSSLVPSPFGGGYRPFFVVVPGEESNE
jgi:hypothetical protein